MMGTRKFLSLFLILCLVLGCAPLSVLADENDTDSGTDIIWNEAPDIEDLAGSPDTGSVLYVNRSWDGTQVVSSDETAQDVEPVPADGSMTSGWYYLNSDVTKNGRIDSITGDVYSNHLQDTHAYSVSDGTYTYTITASVLTFARSCVIKKMATDAEKNLGKTLYRYHKAAAAAFGE